MTPERKVYRPQPGPQTELLANEADIILFGGSAGVGKTFGILLDQIWFHDIPKFTAATFRRNSTQIRSPGGLWSSSQEMFREFDGHSKEATLEWSFPSGAVYKFAHLEHESSVYSWQGSELCAIYFDELTHFTKFQFVYMLSRNRSTCGIKPFIKGTTNPDADSWVRELVDWYIDPNSGIAIPERSGVIRWFIVLDDTWIWANSAEELKAKYPNCFPKSFTFISGSVYDNKKLLDVNPEYLANLNALSRVERERLLHGNWNIKPAAGLYFRKSFFETVKVPPRRTKKVRYWDRAATKKNDTNDPDYTVGLKLEKDEDGIIYVTDMVRIQESPLKVQQAIKNTASHDGIETQIGVEQDPGQAGVSEVDYLLRQLAGFRAKAYKVSSDKVTRCLPASSQAEAGNIKILEAKWNEDFFKELENFPEAKHDDIVDALAGAFGMLTDGAYNISTMGLNMY